jgi:hypothetical protein
MKKTFMSICAVVLLSAAANAQDKKSEKPAVSETPAVKTETANPDVQEKGGTRMAITQKGLPASKKVENKDQKPAATEPKAPPAVKNEKH